jgi:hypothetical protein
MSELLTNKVQVQLGVKASEILGNMVTSCVEFVKTWHNSMVVHINIQTSCLHYYSRTANKVQLPTLAIHLLVVSGQSYYSNPGPNFMKVHQLRQKWVYHSIQYLVNVKSCKWSANIRNRKHKINSVIPFYLVTAFHQWKLNYNAPVGITTLFCK